LSASDKRRPGIVALEYWSRRCRGDVIHGSYRLKAQNEKVRGSGIDDPLVLSQAQGGIRIALAKVIRN
jgi:hypothetical protein